MLVFGFTSNFFFMSSGFPTNVTVPDVAYLTTFGLVDIVKAKLRVTSLLPFFCSSSFALKSKNNSSFVVYCPVRSACRLVRFMVTVTPETEYCGLTVYSSLIHLFGQFDI
jgi:hypothetical protein